MYFYQQPISNHNRRTALERIAQKGAQDAGNGLTYLRPETLAQVAALATQFATALSSSDQARSAQAVATAAANTAVKVVIQHVRDIWMAVKRRTVRDGLPAAVNLYYGLSITGKFPQITNSQDSWLTQAERIIEGEAAAVAAGYPALAGPTVTQLQTKLTAAQTAVNQREIAEANYDSSKATLDSLRQQADSLIATAMHQLRVALREETASRRRDIMRDYGARFRAKTGQSSAAVSGDAPEGVADDVPVESPAMEEEMEEAAAPAAMSLLQPYAVPAVNGNGTAVRV